TRSSEYWFGGGDIILQVESTQFRLFKSILSKHSSVFRDMFTIPLPAKTARWSFFLAIRRKTGCFSSECYFPGE
ncbi:hypothetical protein C8F04DRAFT_952250, partial [Mycena alexandri]